MTQRKINILDKIGSLIPGYKGYAIRDDKRNTDKKLREELANKIQQAEKEAILLQQELIRNKEIQKCQEWEIARKALNTITTKIINAPYGESSFFNNEQIKETELDNLYVIDLELAEIVDLISKTIKNEISGALSPIVVTQQVRKIENILNNRTTFLNKF